MIGHLIVCEVIHSNHDKTADPFNSDQTFKKTNTYSLEIHIKWQSENRSMYDSCWKKIPLSFSAITWHRACSKGQFLLHCADWEHVFLELYYTARLNCSVFFSPLLHRSRNTCLCLTDSMCFVSFCSLEPPTWFEITILSLLNPLNKLRRVAVSFLLYVQK